LDVHLGLSIFLFILCVALSAYFSGSESAFFSLTQGDIQALKDSERRSNSEKRILRLLDKPRRLLMSILIGNTIVNVSAATIAALQTHYYIVQGYITKQIGMFVEIVVVTLVLLIFIEVSPKIFAVSNPLRFSRRVSGSMVFVVGLLTPLALIFDKLTYRIIHFLGIKKEASFLHQDELKTLLHVGQEKGTLDQNEREMIHSIFEFRETTVKEVMIPRMDMVRIEKNTPLDELLALVKEKGHSRIPIYDEKVDNIVGILFVKDLLPYMKGSKKVPNLIDLARKAYFVPESKMIDELLREFQKDRTHMAIVVDEYGGTAGLITLEDVIEEIVGEIRDEYDKEKPLYQKVDEFTWLIEGKINIEEVNEALGLEIPDSEDYESLGGFIFSLLGRIPNDKEEVRYKNLLLIVERVKGQRIQKVRLKKEDTSIKDSDK